MQHQPHLALRTYIEPGFPKYFVKNEQDFDSIKLMQTIQASFSILIWRTLWVKAKRMP
jgi:hypothetical protein